MNSNQENTYLNYFASSLVETFSHLTTVKPEIGVPYIQDDSLWMDYTRIIGISGDKRGYICFTADRNFAVGFTEKVMGEDGLDDEIVVNTICEIANTIAGNAQEHFGSGFMISVPMLVEKSGKSVIKVEAPVYIIPIIWQGIKSNLVIAIEKG